MYPPLSYSIILKLVNIYRQNVTSSSFHAINRILVLRGRGVDLCKSPVESDLFPKNLKCFCRYVIFFLYCKNRSTETFRKARREKMNIRADRYTLYFSSFFEGDRAPQNSIRGSWPPGPLVVGAYAQRYLYLKPPLK